MEQSKPIEKTTHLELENLSLKLQLAQRSITDAQATYKNLNTLLQDLAMKALKDAELSEEEWGIDLANGTFIKKNG